MDAPTQIPSLVIAAMMTASVPLSAQQDPDRRVGRDEFGQPIVLSAVDARTVALFAKAAGVPMGVELSSEAPGRTRKPVTLTGLPAGRALQLMAGFDARYDMREVGGVFVLRPRGAWDRPEHPLHAPVPPVSLRDIRGRNALSLIAAFLDGPQYKETQLGDTRRFSLELPEGTVLDLLNATVRGHGELAWSFEPTGDRPGSIFPYIVSLLSGASGVGCGVPGSAPREPVDVAAYGDPARPNDASASVLDRIVDSRPKETALVVYGPYPSAITDLAKATRVPMGIEFLGAPDEPSWVPISTSGRTLREVLDAMVAADARYEWREMGGVIAVRPVSAWNDSNSLLFRQVAPVQLTDVSPQAAVLRVAQVLGRAEPLSFPDGRPLSVDLPEGTVLDLVNAILRAHGELTWELTPETNREAVRQGYRYTLSFGVMGGGGVGFALR